MKEVIRTCDLVVEVRDARAPLSTANPLLKELAPTKPRLLLLNKADLAATRPLHHAYKAILRDELGMAAGPGQTPAQRPGEKLFVLTTNARNARLTGKKILDWAKVHAAPKFVTGGTMIMVCGMPNVGKSTILNALRGAAHAGSGTWNKQVAAIGDSAGVTRRAQLFCVGTNPLMYMVDTPGIFVPRIEDDATGIKLAMLGCVPEHTMHHVQLSQEILSVLNSKLAWQMRYMDFLRLKQPVESVEEVFHRVERQAGAMGKHNEEQQRMCSRYFIRCFREGKLGRVYLDPSPSISEREQRMDREGASDDSMLPRASSTRRAEVFNLDEIM